MRSRCVISDVTFSNILEHFPLLLFFDACLTILVQPPLAYPIQLTLTRVPPIVIPAVHICLVPASPAILSE